MKRIGYGASMNFYNLAGFCRFMEVAANCDIRHNNSLAKGSAQSLIVQVDLGQNISLSFPLEHFYKQRLFKIKHIPAKFRKLFFYEPQ